MLEVENWITLLGILGKFVFSWRVYQSMTPLTYLRVIAVVIDATNLTVGNALLRTVVITLRTLRNFKTTSLAVATEIGLRCRIDEVDTLDIHEIVVETYRQRIGNSHETALTIGLHIIFLTADVYNHFAGLRSVDAEISTTLFVNLRKLVARNGVLYCYCIGRNFNTLWHLDIRTLRLESQMTCHGLTITATELAIACCIKVQTVRTIATAIRRDNLRGVQCQRQLINLLLTTDANTLTISLNNITCIEVHLFGLQIQVATQIIVNLLHHTCPLRVAGIGLTLMHQDTLDHTILLGFLGQSNQTLIRIIIVCSQHALHPVRRLGLYIIIDTVGQESLDIDTADSHVDDTYLDILGQRSNESTTEPVGRSKTCVRTTQRSRSLTPLTHLSSLLREVHCGHQQETWAWACQILSLRTGIALHI